VFVGDEFVGGGEGFGALSGLIAAAIVAVVVDDVAQRRKSFEDIASDFIGDAESEVVRAFQLVERAAFAAPLSDSECREFLARITGVTCALSAFEDVWIATSPGPEANSISNRKAEIQLHLRELKRAVTAHSFPAMAFRLQEVDYLRIQRIYYGIRSDLRALRLAQRIDSA